MSLKISKALVMIRKSLRQFGADKLLAKMAMAVNVVTRALIGESLFAVGIYSTELVRADGTVERDTFYNLVVNVGKNLMLDTMFAGSAYTAAGYMFLLGASPTPASGDTMTSHSGWTEVGGTNAPTYTGNRQAPSWSAASAGSKSTSAAVSFAITSTGTVGGCGMVYGSGASATKDNTGGVCFSAGAFSGGNKSVNNGDTLNVSYTISV